MLRTTIMLPNDLKQRAEKKAAQMHISLGEFLRLAANSFLDREERKYSDDPLCGDAFVVREPAPRFGSEKIDEYLYGQDRA